MKKLSLKNADSMLSRKEMKAINGGYGGYGSGNDGCTDVYNNTYIEFVNLGLESEAASEAWAAYKECKGL